ncbi:hypothetical protein V8F33_001748 [Rhypophila sp. PSN 637]
MSPPSMQYAHHERQPFNLPAHPSQTARTSRSPPSFNGMDRLIGPVKINTQIYEPYLSISPSGSSARETYSAFQATSDFQTRQMMVQDSTHHQPENPIARFIQEESSWDPLGGRQHLPLNLGQLPEYNIYRNTTAPSEVDTIGPATIISDSAYGSMPRQSVGIPSVYGDMDQCAETQSLIQGVSDFQFNQGLSPDAIPPRENGTERKPWNQHGAAANSDTTELVCPFCKAAVKTKSELKKHEQRHSKPHRCEIDNCPRNGDGFSTLNDLARHKQTVHKIGGLKYRCHLGQCANKKKDWPRADNFKQHLSRVHGQTTQIDLEQFKATPQETVNQSFSAVSETTLPQPTVETHTSSGSVLHWGQTLALNNAMNSTTVPAPTQLDNHVPLSDGPPSIDGSTLGGDVDESQYADHTPFDGMGLVGKLEHTMSSYEDTRQRLPDLNASQGQTMDSAQPCINPDILNHMGLRGSFPGDQLVPKNIPSQILELEPEGQATLGQIERESGRQTDEHGLPGGSHQVMEDFDQDAAADQEDYNDTDSENSGASDRAELSPSPQASSEHDGLPKAEPEAPSSDTRPTTGSPESMNLDEMDASALVEDLVKKRVLDSILQQLGYRMVKEAEFKDQNKESSSSESQTSVVGGRHACDQDQCTKSFSRACELRKHQKRHDKPYACTYDTCDKRFGSKNDWKRHENSQHFQLECWRCNEKAKDSVDGLCGKVCHRRETFTNHLEKDHGLDQKAIEAKWTTCRVGRNCETRFWCGFCKAVVDLEGRNGRFNHIDEHFNGKNGKAKADISEWKNVESESGETFVLLQSPRPQANRGRLMSPDQSRKRRRSRSDDGASNYRRKKFRAEDGEVFWSCCDCNSEWSPVTYTVCMDCSHARCSDCGTEAHKITENATTIA